MSLAAGVGVAAAASAIALAVPAQAYGIYGPQDYNAWLAKISCERITRGVDHDPYKSAGFIQHNLPLGTTQGQAFQFLGAAINQYCPDQVGFIQQAGAH
jgi:Protein of unknown function (DUF732)